MRLLIITDLHSFSDDEYKTLCKVSDYDACFCLGDIDVVDLRVIRNAVQGKIYALNGNHDGWDTSSSVAGVKDMHGKLFNLGDLTFIGMQGAFKYTDCRWRCMYSQPEASEVIKNFPKADILFSHSPPKRGLLFERVGSKSGLSAWETDNSESVTQYISDVTEHELDEYLSAHPYVRESEITLENLRCGTYFMIPRK